MADAAMGRNSKARAVRPRAGQVRNKIRCKNVGFIFGLLNCWFLKLYFVDFKVASIVDSTPRAVSLTFRPAMSTGFQRLPTCDAECAGSFPSFWSAVRNGSA